MEMKKRILQMLELMLAIQEAAAAHEEKANAEARPVMRDSWQC
jgi:hypothetical protein